jgi:hypothetical protein
MEVFGNDKNTRGCFMVFNFNTTKGRGAQLELPEGDMLPETDYAFPLTVTGFRFAQAENAHYVKCFGDYVYTYAFGHDPLQSQLIVEFTGMLRAGTLADMGSGAQGAGNQASKITDLFIDRYEYSRLSQSLKYSKFYVTGSRVLKGFLVGMQSASMDPQFSLQAFSATIQLVQAQ